MRTPVPQGNNLAGERLQEAAGSLSRAFQAVDGVAGLLDGPGHSSALQIRREIAHPLRCWMNLALWSGADPRAVEHLQVLPTSEP